MQSHVLVDHYKVLQYYGISPYHRLCFILGTYVPGRKLLSDRNPATRAKFFVQSLPLGKNDGRFLGGGEKISQTRRNCSLSLQKILKKLRKLRDSTTFLFGELKKPLYFRLKQNNSKIFKYSSLDIQLKYSIEGRCSLTDSFVIYKSLVCIQFLQIIVIFPESPQTFTWGERQNPGGGTFNVEVI